MLEFKTDSFNGALVATNMFHIALKLYVNMNEI